jgi:hypothetical protein
VRYLRSGTLLPPVSTNVDVVRHADPVDDEEGENCGSDKEPDIYNYQEARLRHPFLEYAVKNWAYHASLYDVHDNEFFHSINRFINYESPDSEDG